VSNITLPRADAEQIRAALVSGEKLFAALAALDAALAEPDAKREPYTLADLFAQFAAKQRPLDADMAAIINANLDSLYITDEPAAALAEPVHPGYIIGSHWLETAYSRIAAGEAEDAVLAEVLGERGWAKPEPATDSEIVIAGDEHARDPEYLLDFRDGFRAAERFHGIRKEDK
jgi:hypothetical protein